ncbi:MAG: universal stress protein [Bryobacterales bacterium]|nr:universal stress protein [Bryobacterales bacterium]
MLPFRRILVPVDFSRSCRALTPHVVEMARYFNAEITLLHAFDLMAPYFDDVELGPGYHETLCRREQQRLQEYAEELFPPAMVRFLVDSGEPGAVICNAVRRHGCDLVMLPTHGRGGFRRLLLGSVAAKVLHDVSCAVWTGVHEQLRDRPLPVPYRTILCALNNDDEASDVLRAAAAIAVSFDAKLALLHVVVTPPTAFEADFAPYRAQLVDMADMQIRRMAHEAGIDAPLVIREGNIAAQVREEVLERSADLLVVGRGHAQGALGRLWSGLYETVRESPCPVLSI